MKAVMMAGGKGIRLRPLTYVQPKPLLPVGSITSIEYSIKHLKGLKSLEVKLVWNPPWNKDLMSEDAKLALDIF